uniref:Aminoglycoside 3'-phosphotransferase n=1 Tax=Klebsiella pneumoniae TaxID=573 RepID=A0A8B0SZ96_KLEPN|nr:Aminoglycoside 3'-phosphotransferase [Klebsiella pneumoniae]
MLDESESQTDTVILPSYGTASVSFLLHYRNGFFSKKYGIDNPDMNKLQFHLMLDEFFSNQNWLIGCNTGRALR